MNLLYTFNPMKGMYITTCEIYNIDMYIYKEFQKSIKNKAQAYVYRFLYQESFAYIFNFDVKHSFV
ncbi:hypothetical protein HanPI659440_Chr02g0082851 [Helianthus annuus]|nr:hypothetical protein HanPI659440_Chr02g0082851 [Helianthus annuus]